MKKIIKALPISILSIVALAGCNNQDNPAGGDSTSEPVVTESELAKFVKNIPDGDIAQEVVDQFWSADLLNSGEKFIKQAQTYSHETFYAYNFESAGLTDAEKAALINDDEKLETFEVFPNDVIKVSKHRVLYPYDPNSKNPKVGHAEEPKIEKGYGTIAKAAPDADHLTYLYNSPDKPTDSFKLEMDPSHKIEDLKGNFGFGDGVIASTKEVFEWWGVQSKPSAGEDPAPDPVITNTKNGNKVLLSWEGEQWDHQYLSLEKVLKEEIFKVDADDNLVIDPVTKKPTKISHCLDGLFLDTGINMHYNILIEGNIITAAEFTMFSMVTQVYKDPEYNENTNIFSPGYIDQKTDELLPKFANRLVKHDEAIHADFLEDADGNKVTRDLELNGPIDGRPHLFMAPYLHHEFVMSEKAPKGKWSLDDMPKDPDGTLYNEQDGFYSGAWFDDEYLMNPVVE